MYKDQNMPARLGLPEGSKLKLWFKIDGKEIPRTFEIEGRIGAEGASTVCYKAKHESAGGVLKEFYPEKSRLERVTDKNSPWYLQLKAPDVNSFKKEKERYINAHKELTDLQKDRADVSVVVPYFEIYEGCEGREEGTVYIWSPHREYTTFEKICADIRKDPEDKADEKLKLITDAIESLLECLDVLDEYEISHGDIKPENFGFDELGKKVQTQRLCMYDVDSFCKVGEDPSVSGSFGFYDMRTRADRYNGLIRDVYSVGAVIYYAVVINAKGDGCIYKDDSGSYSRIKEDVENSRLIQAISPDIKDEVSRSVTGILRKCLASYHSRYKSYEPLLEDINNLQKLLRLGNPPYELIKNLPRPRFGFTGREAELEKIEKLLEETGLVFLHGEGGIGKSELAINAAKAFEKKYKVVFAVYKENLQRTVCDKINIKGMARSSDEDYAEYYERKLEALKSIADKNTLLIIDNFNVDTDPEMENFLGGDHKVLFTTKNPHPGYHDSELEIGVLGDADALLPVFKKYYRLVSGKEINEDDISDIKKLIDRFECHTYMVELLAKQLAATRISAKELLQRYEKHGLSQPQTETVEGYKDKGYRTPYDHICEVFAVSELSPEEEEILKKMSILDFHRIDPELFKQWAGLSDFETIDRLIRKGWVREGIDTESNETYFSLHPLVKEVVSSKLKPDAKNCGDFLDRIGEWVFPAWGRPDIENQKAAGHILALAEHFAPFSKERAGVPLDKKNIVLWCMFPSFLWQVNQFESSEKFAKIMLKTCEEVHGISIHTSYCCAQLGNCYHNGGQDEKAKEQFEKALDLIKAAKAEESARDETAWCYARLARSYATTDRPDLKKALYCALKSRNINKDLKKRFEQDQHIWNYEEDWKTYGLSNTKMGLANSCSEASRVYMIAGKYKDGLRYAEESVKEMEEIPETFLNAPSRQSLYSRKGACLYHIGVEKKESGDESYTEELNEAHEILKKCIDIQDPCLGSASRTVLSAKEDLADTCAALNRFEEAAKYYEEIIAALEKYYPYKPEWLEAVKNKKAVLMEVK